MGVAKREERLKALRDKIVETTDQETKRLQRERKLLKLALGDARDGALDKSNEIDELLILASLKEVMDIG
jgi:hypothetical protein